MADFVTGIIKGAGKLIIKEVIDRNAKSKIESGGDSIIYFTHCFFRKRDDMAWKKGTFCLTKQSVVLDIYHPLAGMWSSKKTEIRRENLTFIPEKFRTGLQKLEGARVIFDANEYEIAHIDAMGIKNQLDT